MAPINPSTAMKLLGVLIARASIITTAMPVGDPAAGFARDVLNTRAMCNPHQIQGTLVGFDFAGNPVMDVECRGLCPARDDDDDDGECTWGCAPADYTACSASNCFDGGETECVAQADHSGDHVCAWAGGHCVGCTSVAESSCRAGDHPNCEWNPANGGTCVAKGPTSTPICDSRDNHCPGHEDQDCPAGGGDDGGVHKCSVTEYRQIWSWRREPMRTTATPVVFTPAPNPDFGRIPDEEEILPGMGHRSRRQAAPGIAHERIQALGPRMLGRHQHSPDDPIFSMHQQQQPTDASQTWITGYSCDVADGSCTVVLGQRAAREASNGVTVEYCGELHRQIEREGIDNWLEATGGRAAGCMPFWISQRLLSRVSIPSDCDCIGHPDAV